jgi:DNA topoisomerase-3
MLLVNGKRGKMLVCSKRTCGHRQPEHENENDGYKRSRREQGVDRSLIRKFAAPETPVSNSFGSLLKDALEKKK